MKTIAGAVGALMLGFLGLIPMAGAQPTAQIPAFKHEINAPAATMQLAQAKEDYPVTAADAADIARASVPGSKVLKVQLLPSGVYAVTLKDGDNVSRVMVDATTGSLS